ncbi:MAG: hypothetical protein IT454_15170 [Planctomycetes bacterium]|nr:hypothetical protein [Planctomycetota bacterium]
MSNVSFYSNPFEALGRGLRGAIDGMFGGTYVGSMFRGLLGDAPSLDGLSGTDRLQAMFDRQLAMQQQHELFTMQTNLARTEHESRMNAIRNMRA